MPWTQRTNWPRSSGRPGVGRSSQRTATAMATPATRMTMWAGVVSDRRAGIVRRRSDGVRRPVALGEPVDVAKRAHLGGVGADRFRHLLRATEQPIDLAPIEPDPGDPAFQLIGHVGVLRDEGDIGGQGLECVATQLVEPAELLPPGVREVLVERRDAGVVGPGHHPAPALLEEPQARLAAKLMI